MQVEALMFCMKQGRMDVAGSTRRLSMEQVDTMLPLNPKGRVNDTLHKIDGSHVAPENGEE